jgi:hypothetical protein
VVELVFASTDGVAAKLLPELLLQIRRRPSRFVLA